MKPWQIRVLENLRTLSDAELLAVVLNAAQRVGRTESNPLDEDFEVDDWVYLQGKLELSKRLPASFSGFIDIE